MSSRIFPKGKQGIADDTVALSTGTVKLMPLTLGTVSTLNKAITGATNASPIVVTVTAHGWANGNIVVIRGIGGNTATNGTWVIASVTANTFALTTVPAAGGTALNSTGNGAYTSGGTAFNLSLVSASTDISAGRSAGATDPTLALNLATPGNGIVSASNPTLTLNASTTLDAYVTYQSAPTDRLIHFNDGKHQVRVDADAASSATTIVVEPLYGPAADVAIANGTVVVFSNGVSATLTAAANTGDRSLTVSALAGAIAKGHTADVAIGTGTTAANLPYVSGGPGTTTLTLTIDAVKGLFEL